ncbi:MAG TPA: FadR/GntR family transcriptional regulator [Syntrophorhabdaceae bacterium]|jgi:GntR family transcriptional repressor for pyruvate dehydrogenase complex|nr:FadR/GntR family transcriptional regulator [Synergistales bacterium]MDI9392410.1 FadR/GntR family transcriptional regulator [Synergistota bacterium]MDY0179462.1 FadR/GntR family transcriptional regulator [Synergistaceae bacterium]HNT43278.1 FadR/GntR family transcriptional regulator [Syntrophorhabdaceae bacterium]HRW87195.1 FadR/GntR family transcriptional regulator [Thermovirgaceae bacterium]
MIEKRLRHTRIYEQVVNELKELIASGELLPGDPLPPERQLMSEMGVSRSSLREAFRVMELLGLIDSVPGKGRFVRKPRGETADSRNMPLEDEAVLELMEARRALDPAIAGAAAMHAMPSDLMKLRKVLSRTEKNLEHIEKRSQDDFDFHLMLAEATHNFVFINIVKMTFNLIMATHERIYSLLADKEAFFNEHQTIYEAIIDHDVARAQSLSAGHIERIYRTLQEGLALEVK